MHLKELKLAGFKSFVDPTVIPFPSQLAAIVGPNGCGKSNIIDAVRWVLGESSAKTLRGESMVDVIFNGSSNRKSVGQASVELVFDNSMGLLSGQYASYQEIAIKRLVTRDGDSAYFLNGTRCRRRDIQDVFLGTGAGARGYSIIGQDMISRLIEARPEDLKGYLEEAAGVSKYKERRRETLLRINNTRENLSRVADIREELQKQLVRLERQAKTAERFTILKEQERLVRIQILALKWQRLKNELTIVQQEIQKLSIRYEAHQASLTKRSSKRLILREALHTANDDLQVTQSSLYQLGTKIARLEESQQQQIREKERLSADSAHVQADLDTAKAQEQQDKANLLLSETLLQELQGQLQVSQGEFTSEDEKLRSKQQEEIIWNNQWQHVQALHSQKLQENEVVKMRLQTIAQQRQQALVRLEKIQIEQNQISIEPLSDKLATLREDKSAAEENINKLSQQQLLLTEERTQIQQKINESEQQIHHCQDELRKLATEHAALHAAQQAALQTKQQPVNFSESVIKPLLLDCITVESRWMQICEWVLGESLYACVFDSAAEMLPLLPQMSGSSAVFIVPSQKRQQSPGYPRLSEKIEGIIPQWTTSLEYIFAGESLDDALGWLPHLSAEESIVTLDGYWLGAGWVKTINLKSEDDAGLLSRKHSLQILSVELELVNDTLPQLQAKRDRLHQQLSENQQTSETCRKALSDYRESLQDLAMALNQNEQFLLQAQQKLHALSEEKEELQESIETVTIQQLDFEKQLQLCMQDCQQFAEQKQELQRQQQHWTQELAASRSQVDELRKRLHQLELVWDKEKLRAQQFIANIQREELRINALLERGETLRKRTIELHCAEHTVTILAGHDEQYNELETELTLKRVRAEELQGGLFALEQAEKHEEHQIKILQEKAQEQKIVEQGLSIRAAGLLESLDELDAKVQDVLDSMDSHIELADREREILEVIDKIKRLGAINLIAIEEYEQETLRKQHLDEQFQDLNDALDTLQTAIGKMDNETELRLQATFEQINASFQALFPRLFGGGRAMLELTCDNLLEAGISVIAQPPGKRNSTIHLLSGGEKAMTAVALVFAIFQLNPSPFCLLDEVDAPLDDANVQLFCDMVKEMSQFVQFLFITHNKRTMELADHLIGVTMREPGVSRVVAVDVEQALSLAE